MHSQSKSGAQHGSSTETPEPTHISPAPGAMKEAILKQTQKQQTTAPKQQGMPSQKAWASLQKAKTTTIGLPLPCCPSQGAAGRVAPNTCLARAPAVPCLAHSSRGAQAGHTSRLRWKPGQSSLQGVLGQKLHTHPTKNT